MTIEIGKRYRANISVAWRYELPVGFPVVVTAVSARKVTYDRAGSTYKVSRKEFEHGFTEEPDAETLRQYIEAARIVRDTPLHIYKALSLSPEQRKSVFDAIKATEDAEDNLNKLLLSLATGGEK